MTFPFSAIVEQNATKLALMLCAVDPSIGGVLIRGDKGTAKSTAARALADILPGIKRVPGCAFVCAPEAPSEHCSICTEAKIVPQLTQVPFITLPLGASEDRVLGTLDLELALKGAKRAFQPGLLAAAHRGILYIDEVNLLPDHLVDILLDAAAMGVNSVQREGLSVTHASRFTLIGTMNLEEGDLRPQLLDRFGLMVEVTAPGDKIQRAEVVRRRIAFETDPAAFAAYWQAQQATLREQLLTAQGVLSKVSLADNLLELISHLCCEFEVTSLRADIVIYKAARALAALNGRTLVTSDDIRTAAELALPHRRRRKPFEQPGLDKERLDQLMQQAQQPPNGTNMQMEGSQRDNVPEAGPDAAIEPEVFAAVAAGNNPKITVASPSLYARVGKRNLAKLAPRGRIIQVKADQNPSSLAVAATLRSAAVRDGKNFKVTKNDLHQQVRSGKTANLIIFIVDASGSMAAQQRMEAVKGAVLSLLTDAYQQRDQVAVISFRGELAQVLLTPTRSVDIAEQQLRELPTGGRTPLPHALELVQAMLKNSQQMPPLLVLLTDGKANVGLAEGADPWQESLKLAQELAEQGLAALVLDTETGYLRLGKAQQLAQALGADCLTLEELSAENLVLTIRGCLKPQ
ncbi:MAG: magnesium chelatase subunit D family protein [Methylococcaceae bacterium]|jgi:magnesium chelatase subunit D